MEEPEAEENAESDYHYSHDTLNKIEVQRKISKMSVMFLFWIYQFQIIFGLK